MAEATLVCKLGASRQKRPHMGSFYGPVITGSIFDGIRVQPDILDPPPAHVRGVFCKKEGQEGELEGECGMGPYDGFCIILAVIRPEECLRNINGYYGGGALSDMLDHPGRKAGSLARESGSEYPVHHHIAFMDLR